MNIFQKIIDMRSMTGIEYLIDDELPKMPDGPEKEALLKMQETRSLDEVWALAHEQLGQHEEAAKIRQWIADKPKRDTHNAKSQAWLDSEFPKG